MRTTESTREPDVAALIRGPLTLYVAVSSTVITSLGILAGWTGDHWVLALVLFAAMGAASGILNRIWNDTPGTPQALILASAGLFLPLSGGLVAISGGVDSPMWLLLLVGVLTSSYTPSNAARISLVATCLTGVLVMGVPTYLARGFLWTDASTIVLRLITLVVAWLVNQNVVKALHAEVRQRNRLDQARMAALAEAAVTREHLRETQKMEALGRLSGSVAHDFNNLLTVILGISTGLRESLDGDAEVVEDLDEVIAAGERAAALTRRLLVFSRRTTGQVERVNLNELLMSLEQMLSRLIGVDIQLEIHTHPDALFIDADRGEIEQAIVNLALNARDAMPAGGHLNISSLLKHIPQNHPLLEKEAEPGDHAIIRVSDTGSGMTNDIKDHIFEPFFTTKPAGQGTGIGLATTYAIVTKFRGTIGVETQLGEGTIFELVFPIARRTKTLDIDPASVSDEHVPTPSHLTRVAVVEDTASVRNLIDQILRRAGYQVTTYDHPQHLLDELDSIGSLDLLVTDVVMPHMNGVELARALEARGQQMPVLFVSGYVGEAMQLHRGEWNDMVLAKPFTSHDLLHAVRVRLQAPRPELPTLSL